uniref:RHS repeat-associated core domain-containing protein n=1 Tax=Stenotrophomonas hibiscicola TaxID=86189 RepID=UPI002E795143
TYNDANRMNAVKQGDAVLESYAYNHRGERVLRTPASGAAQITLYDEAGQWLGNYSATGQAQQQAIWLDNYPVALINTPATGVPELAYVQPDHLGTPRVVIDPVRDVAIWEWNSKSEVFGNQIPSADPDGDGVAFELALRFPGQQATDASGLFYNYQREYDPAVGRYSQSDPIGLRGGYSLYSYVDGDPLSNEDSMGLKGGRPPSLARQGGGNSAQRRVAARAQRQAIESNSHTNPIYSRGLSPEEVGSLENAASLISEHDYTQYCAAEVCRNDQNQCTSGDVMRGGLPIESNRCAGPFKRVSVPNSILF